MVEEHERADDEVRIGTLQVVGPALRVEEPSGRFAEELGAFTRATLLRATQPEHGVDETADEMMTVQGIAASALATPEAQALIRRSEGAEAHLMAIAATVQEILVPFCMALDRLVAAGASIVEVGDLIDATMPMRVLAVALGGSIANILMDRFDANDALVRELLERVREKDEVIDLLGRRAGGIDLDGVQADAKAQSVAATLASLRGAFAEHVASA